jgi:hypothetical protein
MSRHTTLGEVPSKSQQDIKSILATYSVTDTPEARETAALYERAARVLDSWDEDDPLAPWQKPQYAKADKPGEIDESKIPAEQREAYQQAAKRWQELSEQAKAEAIRLAMEASARPDCYFDFDFSQWVVSYPPLYEQLNKLLVVLWTIEPGDPFDRLLAALRMSAHLRVGQPSFVFYDQLMKENAILEQIGHWAADESRTKEDLARALEQLTVTLRSWPSVQGALVADHRQVEVALTGDATSWALSESPRSPWVNLAYLANQLPWEQKRAVLALGAITRQNIAYAEEFDSYISDQSSTALGPYFLRRWLRPHVSPSPEPMWVSAQPAAATSHFARLEYEMHTRVPDIFRAFCENEACRRAARLQIALAMYRHDHGAYSQALAELAPDYLAIVPLDPFARQPFQYEPRGLKLPLRGWRGRYAEIRLEPHMPFFWSVGAGNARLKQMEVSEMEEGDSGGESVVRWETVYELVSDEPAWDYRAFVFPLPKPRP